MSSRTPSVEPVPPAKVAAASVSRLLSVDAYRGFVMLLMMGEVLSLSRVAAAQPASDVWRWLAFHQGHVEWVGCSLHDLIQPSFSFLVGVVLPFSLAGRMARGMSRSRMSAHALWRALLLVLLGVFLRSTDHARTYWTFEDTLTQIGLGYGFLFFLGLRPVRDLWVIFGALVVGSWAAFAAWPLPAADFDFQQVGVSSSWLAQHGLGGFAAHWQKNSNLAWAFDTWWLNLFPREKPFVAHPGGYATLSFIPTLGTMVLGLIAGRVLASPRTPAEKIRWLLVAGVITLGAGALLDAFGICPVVKRIWSAGWILWSGGACLFLLAMFYALVDVAGRRRWVFPLIVVGANSIAAYMIPHLFQPFLARTLRTHLGKDIFRLFGPAFEPLVLGAAVLLLMWLILFWMWRRKLFLKI